MAAVAIAGATSSPGPTWRIEMQALVGSNKLKQSDVKGATRFRRRRTLCVPECSETVWNGRADLAPGLPVPGRFQPVSRTRRAGEHRQDAP